MKSLLKKKVIYILFACVIFGGSIGCVDSLSSPDSTLEDQNITEEMFLKNAYPGIHAWADINGDGQPERIQILEEWRSFITNMRIEMGDGVVLEKSFQNPRLPYLTVGDIDDDGDAEVLITFKGISEEDMDFVLCDYKNGKIEEIEVPVEIKRASINAYIARDQSVLRVWKKNDKVICFDYCFKDGMWTLGEMEEFTEGNLGEEKIIQDLCSAKVKDMFSNYWNKEIKIDLNSDNKEDIVQVRDISFSGDHSCTQIRTWLNGKKIKDYIFLNNFALTEILAADLNQNGRLELLVRQEVITSNYGANIFSLLFLEDNHWKEIEVDIDNIIDIAVINLRDDSLIRVASLTDPQGDIVKIYDIRYIGDKIEIMDKEVINDYYNNEPPYFKDI